MLNDLREEKRISIRDIVTIKKMIILLKLIIF